MPVPICVAKYAWNEGYVCHGGHPFLRMYFWWSLYTLCLLASRGGVTVRRVFRRRAIQVFVVSLVGRALLFPFVCWRTCVANCAWKGGYYAREVGWKGGGAASFLRSLHTSYLLQGGRYLRRFRSLSLHRLLYVWFPSSGVNFFVVVCCRNGSDEAHHRAPVQTRRAGHPPDVRAASHSDCSSGATGELSLSVCLCVCLSAGVGLSVCLSTSLSLSPSVYLSLCCSRFICLSCCHPPPSPSVYLSPCWCRSICLSVCPSLSICISPFLLICLPVCLSVFLSLSICVSASLLVRRSICRSVCPLHSVPALLFASLLMCRSICQSTCLPLSVPFVSGSLLIYRSICLSASLFSSVYLTLWCFVRVFVSLSVCLSLSHLCICLSANVSVYLSVCLPACLFVCLCACLPVQQYTNVGLPACRFFSLYTCLCWRVGLSVYLPVCSPAGLPLPVCLPACVPVCVSACLSVGMPVSLFACWSVWVLIFQPVCCLFVTVQLCRPFVQSIYLPACLSTRLPLPDRKHHTLTYVFCNKIYTSNVA